MIGKLHITEQTFAVLNEDGVWECPHAGYEAELNALHYPRPESPDILLPFGHMALHKAAAAYRGSYELANETAPILDLVPPSRPVTSEVITELRQELSRQEASREISPEDAAEARRLLEEAASESLAASTKRFRAHLWRRKALAYAVKDIVERSPNYWINTETGRRVPNPNRQAEAPKNRSKKPKDSSSKPVPQSYNTGGEEPSSNTSGGKKVGKPKAARKKPSEKIELTGNETPEDFERMGAEPFEEAGELSEFDKETHIATKPTLSGTMVEVVSPGWALGGRVIKRAVVRPVSGEGRRPGPSAVAPDGRIVNPEFEKVDRAVSMLREGMGVGPDADLAMSALADMQEEGAEIPGADFNIRERVAADDGFARGAARQILENVAVEAWRKATGSEWDYSRIKHNLEDRTGGSYSIRWDTEDEYRLGRALEALGWDVTWYGKGAPESEGEPQTVRPDLSGGHGLYEGSGDFYGQVIRPKGSVPLATDQDGDVWTAAQPSREAYQRLRFVLSKAVTTTKTRLLNEYAPSHEFIRSVMRLAPDTAPADVWAALHYMERQGAVEFRPLVELTKISEPKTAAGLPEEDANLWRRGEPVAVNVWMILNHMPDTE